MESTSESSEPAEVVVLVHGLGRTRLSMMPLGWELERQGYEVVNWGYSSVCCSVAELGQQLATDLEGQIGSGATEVHFVGHSLGNIIIRWLLANDPTIDAGRVVMLAPPNQGSHEADRYSRWLGWILKPLPELETDAGTTAKRLKLPGSAEVGIIAGRFDGKVSTEETYLEGASAHAVVPAGHTFLMLRQDVLALIVEFLRGGDFVAD